MKTFALFFLLVVTIGGCSAGHHSPREAFLSRTFDRTNYVSLYGVSPESMRNEDDMVFQFSKGLVKSTWQAATNCPACPALEEHLSRAERMADKLRKPHLDLMKKVEEVYDPKTDSILCFHYVVGDRHEFGYLVTRDGTVKKRFSL